MTIENVGKSDSIVKPTWKTWDDFYEEYDAWLVNYDASPASAGLFFSGGEILPDGSIILESGKFETIKIDYKNDTSETTINEIGGPRTRLDMYHLYKNDPQRDSIDDNKGTFARQTAFYKEYIMDMEDAKCRDSEETDGWINTFAKLEEE